MIARLYPRRPRRYSPALSQSSVSPLDGGVRSTSYVPQQPTFDQELRATSRALRAPVAPSVRPPKLPDHLRHRPGFETLVRSRAQRLRTRDVDDTIMVVPDHVADALRSRLSA